LCVKPDVHFLYIPDHLLLSVLSVANIISARVEM